MAKWIRQGTSIPSIGGSTPSKPTKFIEEEIKMKICNGREKKNVNPRVKGGEVLINLATKELYFVGNNVGGKKCLYNMRDGLLWSRESTYGSSIFIFELVENACLKIEEYVEGMKNKVRLMNRINKMVIIDAPKYMITDVVSVWRDKKGRTVGRIKPTKQSVVFDKESHVWWLTA